MSDEPVDRDRYRCGNDVQDETEYAFMSGSHNFQSQQSSAVMRLPVWRTVTRSYALTADNLGQFARMSLLPFLIMVPLSMVATSLVAGWQPQDPHTGMTLMMRVALAVPSLASCETSR